MSTYAFNAGYHAYFILGDEATNPYGAGYRAYQEWGAGWEQARDEAELAECHRMFLEEETADG